MRGFDLLKATPEFLVDITYDLPKSAIAQQPLSKRDAARLLVADGDEVWHSSVAQLPSLLEEGDLVVVNNTRALRARIPLQKSSGGAVEVLLLSQLDDRRWEALAKGSGKLTQGLRVTNAAMEVEIGEDLGRGRRIVTIWPRNGDLEMALEEAGLLPLPPYIHAHLNDPERYQTIYAKRPLSAAAPTAGLHLTEAVFSGLAEAGVRVAELELAVGLDTFMPIKTERIADHEIHSEWYCIPDSTIEQVKLAKRVVAIGTTTARALETWGLMGEACGPSNLFIRRPYDWQVVDLMMTNFHLPGSTLICMIDAFVGPSWRALYSKALSAGYRFASFGDAMLARRAVL